MLITFILGVLAGAATPYMEGSVKRALEDVLLAEVPITPGELKLFTFALAMVAAAVLAWLFGGGSALALTVGGAVGVFGPRAIEAYRRRKDGGDDG